MRIILIIAIKKIDIQILVTNDDQFIELKSESKTESLFVYIQITLSLFQSEILPFFDSRAKCKHANCWFVYRYLPFEIPHSIVLLPSEVLKFTELKFTQI